MHAARQWRFRLEELLFHPGIRCWAIEKKQIPLAKSEHVEAALCHAGRKGVCPGSVRVLG